MSSKLFFLLLLLSTYRFAFAQQTGSIRGLVRDSVGNPISNATVTLLKSSNGAGVAFAKTDSSGHFSFNLPASSSVEQLGVKVTFVGYKKFEQAIGPNNELINVTLYPEVAILHQATVTSRAYVVKKSDTLSFSVGNFRDSTDRVLGDLIKKIPGIEMSSDGTIRYNGRPINNFYIEGDDLLDGRYSIATNNLPSKDIDKVEVIEHNQNIKMLNGIVQSDDPGINIRLKENSKLVWINNADITAGTPSKYSGKLNNMAFKPRIKMLNQIAANNIGYNLNNELAYRGADVETNNPLIILNNSKPPGISEGRYYFNNSQLININDLYRLNSGVSFRVNAYYLHDIIPYKTESTIAYYLPGQDSIGYSEKQDSRDKVDHLLVSLNLNSNKKNRYFNESLTADVSSSGKNVNIVTNNAGVKEYLHTNLSTFSNALNGFFFVHKKHIIGYNSNITWSQTPQNFTIQPGRLQDVLNNGQDYIQSLQQIRLPGWSTINTLNSISSIGHWTFNNTIGIEYKHLQLQSDISLLQNNKETTHPNDTKNSVNWNEARLYVQPGFKYEEGRNRLTIYVPVNYNPIHYNDSITRAGDKVNKVYINPSLQYRLQVGKEHELIAGYSFSNDFATVQQVFAAGILTDYRTLQGYSTPIETGYHSTYNVRFAYKRSLRMFFINAGITYVARHNNFMYSSIVSNLVTQITAIPRGNESASLILSGGMSKYIFALHTTVTADIRANRESSQVLTNNQFFNINTWYNSYTLGFSPRPVAWLKIDLNANYLTAVSSSPAEGFVKHKSSQWKQAAALTFLLFKQLSINVKNEYYTNILTSKKLSDCFLADAYINYRISKPDVELRASCTNIGNKRNLNIINNSGDVISNLNFYMQPRMFLLSAAFRF